MGLPTHEHLAQVLKGFSWWALRENVSLLQFRVDLAHIDTVSLAFSNILAISRDVLAEPVYLGVVELGPRCSLTRLEIGEC